MMLRFGEEFAHEKGYMCHTLSRNKTTYVKEHEGITLFLDIAPFTEDILTIELIRIVGIFTITSGKIQYRHPKFDLFERQLLGFTSRHEQPFVYSPAREE